MFKLFIYVFPPKKSHNQFWAVRSVCTAATIDFRTVIKLFRGSTVRAVRRIRLEGVRKFVNYPSSDLRHPSNPRNNVASPVRKLLFTSIHLIRSSCREILTELAGYQGETLFLFSAKPTPVVLQPPAGAASDRSALPRPFPSAFRDAMEIAASRHRRPSPGPPYGVFLAFYWIHLQRS